MSADAGCGCRSAGVPGRPRWTLALVALAALALVARRREGMRRGARIPHELR
jgi:MYXO-CTERM domain-containing protein